jgi:hypothetical protein
VDGAGFGIDRPAELSKEDDEYEAFRKRMMLAYRFRPNPLVRAPSLLRASGPAWGWRGQRGSLLPVPSRPLTSPLISGLHRTTPGGRTTEETRGLLSQRPSLDCGKLWAVVLPVPPVVTRVTRALKSQCSPAPVACSLPVPQSPDPQ